MNGTYSTSIVAPMSGSKLIDELLRRELRVGDPRNATEVAAALRQRYATDAARIDQEAAGLPYRYDSMPAAFVPPRTATETPGSREERRVRGDLESDLQAVIDSRDSREWAPEFRGWRDVLVREFAEGTAAGHLASDPAMRDRGFLSVRKLGEYARVSRLVGVLNLVLREDFRRLATTLDDAANVVRVLMGEALFASGLADGGHVIQISLLDMRQRREAVILALRRLGGFNVNGLDGEWGDDLASYGDLIDRIDAHSAPELNVYLREELLAPILDGLVGSVARQEPEALRQLAATAPVEIARIRRLLDIIAGELNDPNIDVAPGLTAFADSLRLFVAAFQRDRTGARLIDLSVPLPLAAQQLNEGDAKGRRALLELVLGRGQYAREVDCFLSCCGGTATELTTQVKLDMFLYDLDRAIDLYSLGSAPDGREEQRAGVYKFIADALTADPEIGKLQNLSSTLAKLATTLSSGGTVPADIKRQVLEQLCAEETDWADVVRSLAPNCFGQGFDPFKATRELLGGLLSNLNCNHTSQFPRPAPPRVSLQRIADNTRRGSYGTATPPAQLPVASPARKPTQEVKAFFKHLSNFKDEKELFDNVQQTLRGRWTTLKAQGTLPTMLRDDEVDSIDELMNYKDPQQIDVTRVRDVCNGVLSR